jgi:hypothetical protein
MIRFSKPDGKALLPFLLSFFFSGSLFAQIPFPDSLLRQRVSVGIDLLKTPFANLGNGAPFGFTAEGLVRIENTNGYNLFISLGYSRFGSKEPYPNISNLAEGFFGKIGVEKNLRAFWREQDLARFGACMVISRFTNHGDFFIEGNYFPTYSQSYKHNFLALGFQFYYSETIFSTGRFRFDLMPHFSVLATRVKKNSIENISYYTPGIGIHRDKWFTVGLQAQLFYKFP